MYYLVDVQQTSADIASIFSKIWKHSARSKG